MTDNNDELSPIVDEDGNVLGSILRGQAHDGRNVLHPVVHHSGPVSKSSMPSAKTS